MITVISLLSVFACVGLTVRLLLFHRLIAGLTVVGSWQWSMLAVPVLAISCLVCLPALAISDGWRGALQYFAAVMLLAPPVCTLGARKPGIGAWHWFVVLPMLIVLMWPAMSQLVSSHGIAAVELGVPALVGIGLVMMMSLGTGLGTRMMVPAFLYGLAILCCLGPVTGWQRIPDWTPLFAPWLLLAAERVAAAELGLLRKKLEATNERNEAVDAAWELFQCCYGLPWTRRFQDRVNQFAPREQWTVRLTLDGFRTMNGNVMHESELIKPLDSFCWVLQRFASDEWIERAFARFRPHAITDELPESTE